MALKKADRDVVKAAILEARGRIVVLPRLTPESLGTLQAIACKPGVFRKSASSLQTLTRKGLIEAPKKGYPILTEAGGNYLIALEESRTADPVVWSFGPGSIYRIPPSMTALAPWMAAAGVKAEELQAA